VARSICWQLLIIQHLLRCAALVQTPEGAAERGSECRGVRRPLRAYEAYFVARRGAAGQGKNREMSRFFSLDR
jgi:hypothetical protein